MLERAGERFDMPEPAVDRLIRRRDRKARNRRLATVAVAASISMVGIGVAVEALRTSGTTLPGAGGSSGAADTAAEGWTTFVLPSVAIWAAIAALGFALLALGHMASRPSPPRGTGERPPTGATATRTMPPATAPAARKGNARREVVMGTHVESFPARHTARNVWVTVGALVLLALAIITGIAIGRATVDEPAAPLGLAPAASVQVIDANIVAMNQADRDAFAATFAPEAVFVDHVAGDVYVGSDEITAAVLPDIVKPGDWEMRRTTEVIQMGDLLANGFTSTQASGISVWAIDDRGLITHEWVMPG
jgi:hypothetical protein